MIDPSLLSGPVRSNNKRDLLRTERKYCRPQGCDDLLQWKFPYNQPLASVREIRLFVQHIITNYYYPSRIVLSNSKKDKQGVTNVQQRRDVCLDFDGYLGCFNDDEYKVNVKQTTL